MLLFYSILFSGCNYVGVPQSELLEFDHHSLEKYEFKWSLPDDLYLTRLYEELAVEEIISGADTELEKVKAATIWTHNLWRHDGSNQPEESDPIAIVREAEETGQNFRCVEYSIVLNGVLNSLGIPSRVLALKTKDVETRKSGAGHVVVEAYVEEYGKWVFIDPQWNAIPILDDIPLNAVELQKALAEREAQLTISGLSAIRQRVYRNWISEYLFYFDVRVDNRFSDDTSDQRLMLVPIGADKPRVFQRRWPVENMSYTHSLPVFYPAPFVED